MDFVCRHNPSALIMIIILMAAAPMTSFSAPISSIATDVALKDEIDEEDNCTRQLSHELCSALVGCEWCHNSLRNSVGSGHCFNTTNSHCCGSETKGKVIVCSKQRKCCTSPVSSLCLPTNHLCCNETRWNPNGEAPYMCDIPQSEKCCGGACCQGPCAYGGFMPSTCCKDKQSSVCSEGESPSEFCCSGKCCPGYGPSGSEYCCPKDTSCCDAGFCCPKETTCCRVETIYNSTKLCCAKSQSCDRIRGCI